RVGLVGPGEWRRPHGAHRHPEEALAEVGEGHLVRTDVDAEPVDEVGAPQALGELGEGHDTGSARSGTVPPGNDPVQGARSNQRSGLGPSLISSDRSTTAATVDWLRSRDVSARASTYTMRAASHTSCSDMVGSRDASVPWRSGRKVSPSAPLRCS